MGHTDAFGSTDEPLRRTVFGCLERGPPSGPRFDHTTGEGHVPFHKGDYHDALRHKNKQVALLLVERVLRWHSLRRSPPPPLPRQARLGQETRPRRHQVQQVPPARIPLAPPRSDQRMAAVYTDAGAHRRRRRWPQAALAGRERPRCVSTRRRPPRRLIHPAPPAGRSVGLRSSVGVCVCVTFVTLECVRVRVAFAISSECRSVWVALVA